MAFVIKQGDTRPTYVVQLRENIGQTDERPIDLTNAQSVSFIMKKQNASPTAGFDVKGTCSFLGARTSGTVEYIWGATDTAVIADYDVEFEITWAPGAIETVPNKGYFAISVVADLG